MDFKFTQASCDRSEPLSGRSAPDMDVSVSKHSSGKDAKLKDILIAHNTTHAQAMSRNVTQIRHFVNYAAAGPVLWRQSFMYWHCVCV